MTEQEAFNDHEMKVILLLSGYARELEEGKDFEKTTYKTAAQIVKLVSIPDFIRWNNKHNGIASPVSEKMANKYLENL